MVCSRLSGVFQCTPLCRHLNEDESLVVSGAFVSQSLKARSVLYSEGDAAGALYLVESGAVELTRLAPGGRIETIASLRTGDFFGEDALLGDTDRDHSAVCKDDSTVLWLGRPAYQRLLDDHPRVAGKLLGVLSAQLRRHPNDGRIEPTAPQSRVVSFFGAKGGVGRTFLAANFAAVAARAGRAVCLLELDLQFGNLDALFGASAPKNVWRLDLRAVPTKVVEGYSLRGADRLRVFLRPREVQEAERVTATQATMLVNHLRNLADLVVIDCRAGFDDVTLAALDMSDRIFVVTTGDFGGISATRALVTVLAQLGYSSSKVQLVHNRATSARDVAVTDRSKLFEGTLAATFPDEPRVYDSLNKSQLFAAGAPTHPLCQELERLVSGLVAPRLEEDGDGGSVGFVRKWLNWLGREDQEAPPEPGTVLDSTHPFGVANPTKDPRSAMSEVALGQAHFLVGRYDVAARAFEKALRRDPCCAVAFYYLGEIARHDGNPEGATRFYAEAHRLTPRSLRYRSKLALVSKAPNQVGPELAALTEASTAHPEFADVHCLMGYLLAHQGLAARALEEVDAALKVNPGYIEALTLRASLQRSSRQYMTALTGLLGLLQLNPAHVPALHELGLICSELELWTPARQAFARALEVYPGHHPSHRHLVEVNDSVRIARQEIEQYGEAARLHPRFGDLAFKLGFAYYQVFEFERARASLTHARECGYAAARIADVNGLMDKVEPLLRSSFLNPSTPRSGGELSPP